MKLNLVEILGILLATGLLTKIVLNTEDIKTDAREMSGKIQNLEKEIEKVKKTQAIILQTNTSLKLTSEERQCLIKNVYHEAGVEKMEGKIAVAQTTLNRVNAKRWKNSVCGVVYQRAQFSWTLDKKKREENPKGKLWEDSKLAVEQFEKGARVKNLGAAKFYHTNYIKTPRWADNSKKLMQVGLHIFYSEDAKI